jgi:hypothetical protein
MMATVRPNTEKVAWSGQLLGVQPRIRLLRSFDQRQHSYQGYVLRVNGTCGTGTGQFLIAVGLGAHEKYRFRAGMELSGQAVPVNDPQLEAAGFYKTSGLKVLKGVEGDLPAGAPFVGVPPDLATYRTRRHRRLDARTYEAKCTARIWGWRMPVERTG